MKRVTTSTRFLLRERSPPSPHASLARPRPAIWTKQALKDETWCRGYTSDRLTFLTTAIPQQELVFGHISVISEARIGVQVNSAGVYLLERSQQLWVWLEDASSILHNHGIRQGHERISFQYRGVTRPGYDDKNDAFLAQSAHLKTETCTLRTWTCLGRLCE